MSIRPPPAISAEVGRRREKPRRKNDAYVNGVRLSIFQVLPGKAASSVGEKETKIFKLWAAKET